MVSYVICSDDLLRRLYLPGRGRGRDRGWGRAKGYRDMG